MYDKILVPLDGSKLAECVLPYVETLAKGCETKEVMLATVTEEVKGYTLSPELREISGGSGTVTRYESAVGGSRPFGGVVDRTETIRLGKMQDQGAKYLNKIAKRLRDKGLVVQTKVLIGTPAESIISYITDSGADIVIMSSHGRSGPTRWAFGATADRVFRASCVPVMMVRAPGCPMTGA